MDKSERPEHGSDKRLPWSTDEVVHLINSAPTIARSQGSERRSGQAQGFDVPMVSLGPRGKSKAATRKVPIHSQLVEIINSRINGKAQTTPAA